MPHRATARVVALYRHPVKSFTPQSCDSLTVQADGRIAGDRVLAFRFADATQPEDRDGLDRWAKSKGLALQEFPALAALRLDYDDEALRIRITRDDVVLVDAGLDDAGRAEIESAVTDYVLASSEGKRLQRPGRLPLSLLGDGIASRFQDQARGYVTLHSRESVAALGGALGQEVDDRRFRSNVVIEGVGAWDELEWQGRLRIGEVTFTLEGTLARCLATHANPDTGVRDAKVLTTLTTAFDQPEPTLGRMLLPVGDSTGRVGDAGSADSPVSGVIRVGDEVLLA
ncbi:MULTISPECIES: MOSC domain-containing protein [unclassified Microbacterium]|uniref:MOSC domain-containing protein n=1 Tax=unclassified Microbacterium TaxID=2609290 RepID=UPI0022F12A9C|nr:MOSC domain-containing protein [Streptomyces sp. MS2A]